MTYEAVTFDYWNTLVYEDQQNLRDLRLRAWLGLLEERGFAVEREQLHAVFESAWERFVAAWKANEQFQVAQAAEHALERLGFDVPADLRDELVSSFSRFGENRRMFLTENVADCLRTLKGAGLRLAIICDVGFTPSPVLRAFLDRHGLLELFDHWSFSDEVGCYKPSPVIFEHALAGLGGVAAERVAHVGDIRRTDIAGAKALGITAVRYTGVADDRTDEGPEGDVVIADLAELPAVLGV